MWSRALAAVVGMLVFAAPAAAATLPPTSDALPGSSFQGGDGNQEDSPKQEDSPPLIDWQGLQTSGNLLHGGDENAADSAFAGGSKESEPDGWEFTTVPDGVSPGQSNILDTWSSVDQPSANTFFNFVFTRASAGGTTYAALELNRDGLPWDNGHAMIPCRRTGDVLVSYVIEGTQPGVSIEQWTTATADPGTGCASTGSWHSSAAFVPNEDVQGAINSSGGTNFLIGTNTVPGPLPADVSGEASLNLSRLLSETFSDQCMAFTSVWMHTRSSDQVNAALKDYVEPRATSISTCSASGTKFFDSNANGVRDAGEPGIPRFVIWADYDNDGVRDSNEPFSVTDKQGKYVIYDIRPPSGTYMLREQLLSAKALPLDWICSYPNTSTPGGTGSAPGGRFGCAWGPISLSTTPNATGRDFGNWFPAQLTLRKQLEPVDDPGRFDLLVNGAVALASAGDGAQTTINLAPGTYDVSESAAAGTNAGDYRSTVECRTAVSKRPAQRSGPTYSGLTLLAGRHASCVFRNIRRSNPLVPQPGIGIVKTGPATATAGDTLHYTLYVTNPGDVPFPEAAVVVTDPNCDAPPALDSKEDSSGADGSPGTLDPGDTWTYSCSHKTSGGGAGCKTNSVPNRADVTGSVGASVVTDDDSITTTLRCPNKPVPPDPVEPVDPSDPAGPVQPPGPTPPDAGEASRARIKFRTAIGSCLRTHVPHVNFEGTRIARVRIFVNGHLHRNLTVKTLQRRVTPRVTLPPGRYRVTANVTFEPGSGTPPVTLTGQVRICGARRLPAQQPPTFTG